jgi:hypothetical protein
LSLSRRTVVSAQQASHDEIVSIHLDAVPSLLLSSLLLLVESQAVKPLACPSYKEAVAAALAYSADRERLRHHP